jgi:hypothetical protein
MRCVDSYPKWQAWMCETQPRLPVLWGKYDPSFDLSEPEAYRRDESGWGQSESGWGQSCFEVSGGRLRGAFARREQEEPQNMADPTERRQEALELCRCLAVALENEIPALKVSLSTIMGPGVCHEHGTTLVVIVG